MKLKEQLIDALSVVSDVVENSKIVAGGGAVEIEVAKELRKYANKVGGREQLAIEAFADAMEVIPQSPRRKRWIRSNRCSS